MDVTRKYVVIFFEFLQDAAVKTGAKKVMSFGYHPDANYQLLSVDHHDNGNKSVEGKFLNGKQEGVWAYYHKNGNRFRTGKYLNGRANGQWVIWRMDGSKWSEKNYVNGQLNGIETRWHPNGQKQSETEWGGGKILSKKEWDESGTSKP